MISPNQKIMTVNIIHVLTKVSRKKTLLLQVQMQKKIELKF